MRRPPRSVGDPRDALAQQLDLPTGDRRFRVSTDDRTFDIRPSDVRTLAVIGAFRVSNARDLSVPDGRTLERLRDAGLVDLTPHHLDGERTQIVTLTSQGKGVLERCQREDADPKQAFYAGAVKPRELTHDAQLCAAYTKTAERLHTAGHAVRRVVLDYELKREYQRFLQAHNRGNRRSSGRPDRSLEEIQVWAKEHDLPIVNGRVQFPDVRIEYERPDGQPAREDVELATGQYSTRQMAAKRASGFTVHHSRAAQLGGGHRRSGGGTFDPHVAERVLR